MTIMWSLFNESYIVSCWDQKLNMSNEKNDIFKLVEYQKHTFETYIILTLL